MFLFLQGVPQIGKSTILRTALLPRQSQVAGFMVQRLFNNGQRCGFNACVVRQTLPQLEAAYTPNLPHVFLHNGRANPKALESAVAGALQACQAESCKLIILDEIGGLELLQEEFMQVLRQILALGKPCVGVIKSRQNLAHMAQKLGLPGQIMQHRQALHQTLAQSGRVLTVTGHNKEEVAQEAQQFVANAVQQ